MITVGLQHKKHVRTDADDTWKLWVTTADGRTKPPTIDKDNRYQTKRTLHTKKSDKTNKKLKKMASSWQRKEADGTPQK